MNHELTQLEARSKARPRSELAAYRFGFTLVELLVAVTVMAILASLVLVGLANANGSAREARTRATIAKLNALIMRKYESYRTCRVPINVRAITLQRRNNYPLGHPYNIPPAIKEAQAQAMVRLDALRELMRMEMPDRWSDIYDDPTAVPTQYPTPQWLPTVPAVTRGYRNTLRSAGFDRVPPTTDFQDAKCLYLIITRGCDEPDVLEQFSTSEIGVDPDDGLNYFLDGWGRPIGFRRWAPGFFSTQQPWDLHASPQIFAEKRNHDPFDPLKAYKPRTGEIFYDPRIPNEEQIYPPLYPLIFSAGSDGIYEVYHGTNHRYDIREINNNPYIIASGGPNLLIGAWFDQDEDNVDGRIDNITNHEVQ